MRRHQHRRGWCKRGLRDRQRRVRRQCRGRWHCIHGDRCKQQCLRRAHRCAGRRQQRVGRRQHCARRQQSGLCAGHHGRRQ
nr:hypothetical protein [Xanthomonas phaseoli]